MPDEIKLKTSRKKFFFLYIFIILLILLYPESDFARQGGIYNYAFFSLVFIILLYIEIKIIYSSYILTSDNVIEIKGIIAKQKTSIPFSSISHVVTKKDIIGAILNYGDVIVTSFTDQVIILEGISKPEKASEIIERKVEKQKAYKNH
jgi:uncharacterized membrane protein YdbT with pleckstrin-like domain